MPRTSHATESVDPDYVLLMVRFHIAVFDHNPDECDVEACDYCSWDYHDTYNLLVHFVKSLDDWMITNGRAPRVWRHPIRRRVAAIRRATGGVLRALAEKVVSPTSTRHRLDDAHIRPTCSGKGHG